MLYDVKKKLYTKPKQNNIMRIELTGEVMANIDRICQREVKKEKKSWHPKTNLCWYFIKRFNWKGNLVLTVDGVPCREEAVDKYLARGWAVEVYIPEFAGMKEVKTLLDAAWKKADRLDYEHEMAWEERNRNKN